VCGDNCQWSGVCTGQGTCNPGDTRGCGKCGTEACTSACQWSGTCGSQGVCVANQDTQPCGNCGSRTCTAQCQWPTTCGGEGPCTPGTVQTCGKCGSQTCTAQCTWPATCGGEGVCTPGQTVACGSHCGTQTCTAQCGFGACVPTGVCGAGESQPCGYCNLGTQACTSSCGWGTCAQGGCNPGTTQSCQCADGSKGLQACNNACGFDACICRKYVFVSSKVFDGAIGGLAAADKICTDMAASSKELAGGTYMAWLSAVSPKTGVAFSPSNRFPTHNTGPYVLPATNVILTAAGDPTPQILPPANAIVANSWSELVGGRIRHAIDTTEGGDQITVSGKASAVWTNTGPDGSALSKNDCASWTVATSPLTPVLSYFGDATSSDSTFWTHWNTDGYACDGQFRLYCFQQ
jgi:hypothetical protein